MDVKKITLLSLLMLININYLFPQGYNIINNDAINAIENSIKPFLDSIPDEILNNYGLKEKGEINKIILGNPIAVYSISNDSLIFTNTWRIPLIIDNDYRSLFTVFRNFDGDYKIVDFGAVLLAHEIFTKSKDFDLKGLLRIYQLHKDFFICINNKGEFEFQPIPNPFKNKYNLTEILNFIK